ncbi:hypothetical protein LGZ99_21770 [Photorhabdus temperata]|uniref:Photorhabdus luminescens subsp. laumondii TTO1 complete genome segment 10/17 n=1 Tax=Photorhabdus laumondii subsp. laumondii (strain DSM 15139 / CIP 105565 / TT01) TaxID=243265 RepID=Q7N329_PHOLL|nr:MULTISPECIES: hypothetical protein [Photorhabdus]AWK42600.1 hypothetical protein A4R40_14425 [Photorhabdus laumondii subsp. laumondii]AXG47925.1 hypothetical protein PluTT01m_14845 [Photorhabdus laumondii subsp. laumondii]MCT8349755.1 hypothetical protein [Photorhabdus temperata]CAE15268.1 unnamed protein product [Photorhabdus laumondii subsp. laumondii TTO1]
MIKNSGNFKGAGLKALEARIRALSKKKVVVGVPASKNSDQDGTSIVTIAVAHEFGAEIKVPARAVTVYRKMNKDGSFAGKGKFVKATKSNFASTHTVPAHTINIPERSFLRSTFNENKDKYANKLVKGIKSELKNDGDPQQALEKLGEMVARDVKRKIQAGIDPPLSQATIKRKKSSKPLIDTGQLVQSITYEVRDD